MLKLPQPKKVTLATGVTLLYQRNPVTPTIAFGVWFGSGSRHESSSERGLSHLLEHMVFRGTGGRSAIQIALDLESIGGQWDAFTSKESTCYFGKVLESHFEPLADVFADILQHPSIPPQALSLERKVVRAEIKSVGESPEEAVHELFFETLFQGHPLGHPVTGYYRDLGRYTREKVLAFHRKVYTRENALLGFVGNVPLGKVAAVLEDKFRFGKGVRTNRKRTGDVSSPRMRSVRKYDVSRAHMCIGGSTLPASDPKKPAVILLSSILGGGVSSRLFQRMREETGLAYSVYSNVTLWSDTGVLYAYFSVDPRNLPHALDIFHEVLDDLRRGNVKQEEIDSAKAQVTGSIVFGMESVDNRLFRLIQGEYYYKRYISPAEAVRSFERIDRDMITEAAQRYLGSERLCYASYGPAVLKGLARKGRAQVS
jgi:predicted Zn-dependent peptidase